MSALYQAVIFDLDGVICSTDQYHYKAWKALADRLGIPFDERTNNRLRGVSRLESLAVILGSAPGQNFTDEQKQEMAAQKNELYRQMLRDMTPADLSGDVLETLLALRQAGLKVAIGSSSKNSPYILQQIGLRGFFDAEADGNDIANSKPHPEVFLLAARRLGLAPADCLVVEDAKSGLAAAVAGGFDSAAIGDAFGDGRARYHMERLSELPGLILRAN